MEEEQKRTLFEPKLEGVRDMILEYKLQLDERAWEQEQDVWMCG